MARESRGVARRSVLATCGTLALGGCVKPLQGAVEGGATGSNDASGDWRMAGRDAAHNGFSPDATGPSTPVGETWEGNHSLGRTDILGSPVIEDSRLYVGCGRTVYSLALTSGEEHWSREVEGYVNRYTPAVADGSLYVVGRGEPSRLWSIATADGSVEWKRELPGVSAPLVGDGRLYMIGHTDAGDRIHALDPEDGIEDWSADLGKRPGYYATRVAPALDGERLYMGTTVENDAGDAAGRLFAFDAADGKQRWHHDLAGTVTRSGVAIADGVLYLGDNDGVLHAIDASDRTEQWRLETESQFWTTPAIGHGRVYAGSVDGEVHALDRETGDVAWQAASNITYADPVLGSDRVYAGGNGLVSFEADTGEVAWRYNRSGSYTNQFTSPLVVGDVVAAASCLKTEQGQRVYDDYVTVLS